MKKTINIILVLLFSIIISSCGEKIDKVTSSEEIYIRKIENLPDDFIMGMDVSSVLSLENSGVIYQDYDGNEADLFQVLAQCGITHIRVRVWNDPFDSKGNGYGGGNCNIDTAVEIGKRAKKYGLKLIVDFHYSDFWADPGKQMVPKEWKDMDIETKANALYEYTRDSLKQLKSANIDVAMVTIGNETNGALAGEKTWMNIVHHLMASGSKAIREVYPKALIAVHFANPEKADSYADYAKKLDYYDLDYDVFASSYYPFWHGTLDNLANVLNNVADTYGKKTMIMETSYAYTPDDSDFFGNTIGEGSAVTKNYPYTVQGQANSVLDVIDTAVNKAHNCLGICYWEGAWITVGTDSFEENSAKWEEFGSGWASSYAKEYDPNDAGRYYGGSAVDNQAFFDQNGFPLESLKLFELCRKGNEIEIRADAAENAEIRCDINGEISLPETVNAVMNDGSKKQIPVSWNDTDFEELRKKGPGTYFIDGHAEDLNTRCILHLEEFNYIQNYSFEEDADKTFLPASWDVNKIGDIRELYVEKKKLDSLSGENHYHFWSDSPVEFSLEQEIKDLSEGDYRFSISIMGGDAGETDVYAYVKIDDQIIAKAPMEITFYNSWDTGTVESFHYDGNAKLTVGIHVKCQGEGSGAWGKIDDALLNKIGG